LEDGIILVVILYESLNCSIYCFFSPWIIWPLAICK